MAGNLFDNQTMSVMYQDALQSLYNGNVMPWERDLLAQAPLPADMVDPFASEDVNPLSVMNLTYASLSGWIADAKKEKYYSERFVQLSKLVMKGVSTMARGLVTLHQRGEDLLAAPMQINDLISVGSYHFRKSYLGVVQFSSKHPEIGERLLVNQLGWATTLMRLYKTEEKLNSECGIRNAELPENKKSKTLENEEGTIKREELPAEKDNNSYFSPLHSSLDEIFAFGTADSASDDGFDPLPALSEPGGYGAIRAFKPLKGCRAENTQTNEEAEMKNEEVRSKNEDAGSKNEEGRSKNEEEEMKNEEAEMKNEEAGMENEEVRSKNEEIRMENERASDQENEGTGDQNTEIAGMKSDDQSSSSDLPSYLEILKNVMERSDGLEDGSPSFTCGEMSFLAQDPGFNQIYPQTAEKFRNILAQIDLEDSG